MTKRSVQDELSKAPERGTTPAAPTPELDWAFSIRVDVAAPVEQGEIAGGKARFIPIIGGAVYGPRLSGAVLPAGGDWQTIYADGIAEIKARYFVRTDDDTVVEIQNPGLRIADEEVTAKLARGVAVPENSYYFRTQPRFRVADGPYSWLKRYIFIARGVREPDRVIVDFYLVK